MYIYDRGDVVSAIGATVVGLLGSIYGHYSEGDALPSMMPGILILLPVSIAFLDHKFSFPQILIPQDAYELGWLIGCWWAQCQLPKPNQLSHKLAKHWTRNGPSHHWHYCWSFRINCTCLQFHVDSQSDQGE